MRLIAHWYDRRSHICQHVSKLIVGRCAVGHRSLAQFVIHSLSGRLSNYRYTFPLFGFTNDLDLHRLINSFIGSLYCALMTRVIHQYIHLQPATSNGGPECRLSILGFKSEHNWISLSAIFQMSRGPCDILSLYHLRTTRVFKDNKFLAALDNHELASGDEFYWSRMGVHHARTLSNVLHEFYKNWSEKVHWNCDLVFRVVHI